MLCARFCPDSPYSLVVGGEKNGFHVINVSSLPQGIINLTNNLNACKLCVLAVMQRFKDRELIAPVTPPSQVFTSLVSKPPTDNVSVCAWLCYCLKPSSCLALDCC